jgi:apolipoprotein N-acyltransferase
VVRHTDTFQQQAIHAPIAWLEGRTPYNLWGDAPWWLSTAAIVAMGFVRRKKRSATPT